jgi:hypothetical protein
MVWHFLLHVFFGYIFFINQKRGTSLALLGTLGLYFILNLKWDKIIVYAVGFVIALFRDSGSLFFPSHILDRLIVMYYDVYQVSQGIM